MSTIIIANKLHFFSIWILNIQKVFYFNGPVNTGLKLSNTYMPLTIQWLDKHKYICSAITFIFAVKFYSRSWLCRDWYFCFFNKLHRLLIHAYLRYRRIIRQTICINYIFHTSNKLCILFRRYTPIFIQVRFNFVFFKTRKIVVSEIWSTILSSINWSASNCKVQRQFPSGALLQAIASRCASPFPSNIPDYNALWGLDQPNSENHALDSGSKNSNSSMLRVFNQVLGN